MRCRHPARSHLTSQHAASLPSHERHATARYNSCAPAVTSQFVVDHQCLPAQVVVAALPGPDLEQAPQCLALQAPAPGAVVAGHHHAAFAVVDDQPVQGIPQGLGMLQALLVALVRTENTSLPSFPRPLPGFKL